MAHLPTNLEVRLGDRPIGSLTKLPGDTTAFHFNTDYVEDAQRPTLSLGALDAYRDGRTPALAPAYDYVCTKAYLGHSETGLGLGSARDFSQVTIEQFDRMVQRATVSTCLFAVRRLRWSIARKRNGRR